MHRKTYKPRTDAAFMAWSKNIYEQSNSNQTAWGLKSEDVETLGMLVDNASSAFDENNNRELANHMTSAIKRARFNELSRFIMGFTNVLIATSAVSDADIDAMHLRPRNRQAYRSKPKPVDAPSLSVVNKAHGELLVYVSVEQHGHPVSSLGDPDYIGFALRYRIEGEEEWHEILSTGLRLTVRLQASYRNRHITCVAAWLNPRLERGPYCNEVTVMAW